MAVLEIARIQVRRGEELQTGVPQLEPGEFGWAEDTEHLYIGKRIIEGAADDNNTRILTENDLENIFNLIGSTVTNAISYQYRESVPYIINTVPRSIQSKFDDTVSIADFGVIPSSTATDITVELRRAIGTIFENLTWNSFERKDSRRKLIIPAGNYLISGEINLPPYTSLMGEGSGLTNLTLISTGTSMFRTIDADGHAFESGSMDSGIKRARSVQLKGMTLEYVTNNSTNTNALLRIDNVLDALIEDVTFRTSFNSATTSTYGLTTYGVGILIRGSGGGIGSGDANFCENIQIEKCRFDGLGTGIKGQGPIIRPVVNNCVFSNLQKGVEFYSTDTERGPSNAHMFQNRFENIVKQAIYVDSNNTYITKISNMSTATSSTVDVFVGNAVTYPLLSTVNPIDEEWFLTGSYLYKDKVTKITSSTQLGNVVKFTTESTPYSFDFSTSTVVQSPVSFNNFDSDIDTFAVNVATYPSFSPTNLNPTDGTWYIRSASAGAVFLTLGTGTSGVNTIYITPTLTYIGSSVTGSGIAPGAVVTNVDDNVNPYKITLSAANVGTVNGIVRLEATLMDEARLVSRSMSGDIATFVTTSSFRFDYGTPFQTYTLLRKDRYSLIKKSTEPVRSNNVSENNFFIQSSNGPTLDDFVTTQQYPIIDFRSLGNQSINDHFERKVVADMAPFELHGFYYNPLVSGNSSINDHGVYTATIYAGGLSSIAKFPCTNKDQAIDIKYQMTSAVLSRKGNILVNVVDTDDPSITAFAALQDSYNFVESLSEEATNVQMISSPVYVGDIFGVTLTDVPVKITTAVNHNLLSGAAVTLTNIGGTIELTTQTYYISVDGTQTNYFYLWNDPQLTSPVNGTTYTPYFQLGEVNRVLTPTQFAVNSTSYPIFFDVVGVNPPPTYTVYPQQGWYISENQTSVANILSYIGYTDVTGDVILMFETQSQNSEITFEDNSKLWTLSRSIPADGSYRGESSIRFYVSSELAETTSQNYLVLQCINDSTSSATTALIEYQVNTLL